MKVYRYPGILISGSFIFLCLLHYFSLRPLWLDENFILINLKALNLTAIFGPLEHNQAFPRVYLALIKVFSRRFDYNLLALRFFPLLAGLAGFFIWLKLYQKVFSGVKNQLLAIFSFCGSYYLSYYACELKPYSMDLMVVGLFCLYFYWQRRIILTKISKVFIFLTLLLPLCLFFSYAAFFVFWIVAYNFIFAFRRDYKLLHLAAAYLGVSALIIYLIYSFDLKYTFSLGSLFSYWNDYFISADSWGEFLKSFGEGLRKFSVFWFGKAAFFRRAGSFFMPFFTIALFGYGFKSLKKDKFRVFSVESLGLVIFLELFLAGILRKYPFTGERVTLFFAPFVFYYIIKGLNFFRQPIFLNIILNSVYAIFLGAGFINALWSYLHL